MMRKAAVARVRVNDRLALLPPPNLISSPLVIGVRGADDTFHAARVVAHDAAGRDLEVRVPFGTPLKLWVYSWKVRLQDAAGTPVDHRGARIPFQIAEGDRPLSFTLEVIGDIESERQ
jgi:hypothetical protein